MFIFTYNDYLDCIQNRKVQKKIDSESARTKIQKNTRQNDKTQENQNIEIDEIIEKLLNNKKEIANFIRDFFKVSNWDINENTLSKVKISGKTVIYQYKNQEVYFFIKLQKEPNYNITYNVLNECTIFFKNWKTEKSYSVRPPIIVPIVIYVGKKNWNIKENTNIRYTSFGSNCINLFYNFVDLQKCKPVALLRKSSIISKINLLKMQISNENKRKLIQMLENEIDEFDIFLQLKAFETKYINI